MKHHLEAYCLLFLTAFGLPAQTLPSASLRATRIAPQPNPATTVQERVFPRIVSGDGWETAIVLLNMGPGTVKFRQFFLDAEGAPVTVTVRPQPDADVLTTAAVEGSLAPNSTLSLTVFATPGPCRESWSLVSYDGEQGTLGGYATIRRRARNGQSGFEATLPSSAMQDVSLYVPFDNTQGFRTQLTLVNPASNLAAQVRLTYLSPAGDVLLIDSLIMKPGQQTTLILPDTYPDLAQKAGNVIVESNIDRFSAVALRYNDATGAIFAAPAINGPGTLQ